MQRVFLGISIPQNLKNKIKKIQEEFQKEEFDIKFVEFENLHFNLKFFGKKTESEIKKIESTVKKVLKKHKPFKLKIEGSGAFPGGNYIRVIWIGTKNSEELTELVNELEEAFSKINIEKEKRKFKAHLTIGRVRSNKNQERLIKKINELKEVEIGEFEIEELILFESKLSPKGPTYIELIKFKIGE